MWSPLSAVALRAAEAGRLPDPLIRAGIRRLLATRLRELDLSSTEAEAEELQRFLAACRDSPIAAVPELANAQHYEVPPALFQACLGPRLKYSCCWWGPGVHDLAAAEEHALAVTCERAGLADGQHVLELGCGWGSLSLWMAERYPAARITAVSNSRPQREFIARRAEEHGLRNLQVVTADINQFSTDERFDRVVSVEMFEHLRNHAELQRRIAGWLERDGRLFVHIFCHRSTAYMFEDHGPQDWMARYFFTGGMMPSDALLLHQQQHLAVARQWRWDGRHYEQTSNAWLARFDAARDRILPVVVATYGPEAAPLWMQRWRIFFMACAELFGYRGGREWWVAHYLFEPRA